jgi:hypothetical protein
MVDKLPTSNITYQCNYNKSSESSLWFWTYNGTDSQFLPECKIYCEGEPPEENLPILNGYWDGNHWSDSVVNYKCHAGMCISDMGDNWHYRMAHKVIGLGANKKLLIIAEI